MILSRQFFTRNPMTVAHDLVGAYLCRATECGIIRARICELELYTEEERACHAYAGRRSERNDAMFMAGGHAYVYLCYGLHNMLNIAVGGDGYAAAVLIRALEYDGCDGPGKLTRRLGITRADNKLDLTAPGAPLWVEAAPAAPKIIATTRIGVDYAGADALLPWRFIIDGSPYVSAAPKNCNSRPGP